MQVQTYRTKDETWDRLSGGGSHGPGPSLTIWNAASADKTLIVMTVVAAIFVPVVLAYQGWSYWVFRQRLARPAGQPTYIPASLRPHFAPGLHREAGGLATARSSLRAVKMRQPSCCGSRAPAGRSGQPARRPLVGFLNSATGVELGFHAARSYSWMRPPRTGRPSIRSREGPAAGWSGRGGPR